MHKKLTKLFHPATSISCLVAAAVVCWIVLVTALWAWNWTQEKKSITSDAKTAARSIFNDNLVFRRWCAMHGGVYVPVTSKTLPNPYLAHLPNRDIITQGKHLTLINPDYMIRQIHELQKKSGEKDHLTSLKPLRVENAPDAWEKKALRAFKSGIKEVVSIEEMGDGKSYLRLMRPLRAETSCLKCHASQGYRTGKICGGISASVPFAPYAAEIWQHRFRVTFAYVIIGFLGLIGFRLGSIRIRRYEKEIKKREEQLLTLINATPDIICFKDGQGRWLEANESTLETFSLTGVDYRGKTNAELDELIAPIYRQAFRTYEADDEKVWQSKTAIRVDETVHRHDGTEKIYDLIKVPLFEANGRRKALIILGRDITDRKQAEAKQELLMSAIEQTPDSIIITDADGMIQYINPSFNRITDYTREETIGRDLRMLWGGRHDDALYKEIWDTLTKGNVWNGRIVGEKKDGSLFTEETTISPVRDSSGRMVNYIAVKHDITRNLQLEKEKVLAEEQYHQAQKMESIGRLAGGVAHDLNNLLTPIFGYGGLLLESPELHANQKKNVEQILKAGRRSRDIVRQLLAFSRKQTIETKPVDLNKVVTGFQKLLRRTIREDIAIELALASSLPLVMGNIGQLEQIIMNLAINAQDAMPDGGRLVMETQVTNLDTNYVAIHPGVKSGTYVMLSVSDTGCGMDAETRKHIFEPFFTTKDTSKGTGLGLATVYGIIKQHKGNVWIYSEPGTGTTFKIYLPASKEGHTPEKSIPRSEPVAPQHGKETILLAEDEDMVRDLTIEILKKENYTVLAAASGEEALAIMNGPGKQVDLLLTDVVMPGMTGKDLFDRISIRHPDLKVLYMSGYPENVIADRGVLKKGVHFIQKPFSVKELSSKIREMLDQT